MSYRFVVDVHARLQTHGEVVGVSDVVAVTLKFDCDFGNARPVQ